MDLTAENASYAADNGVNLIISHHPFLFRSLHEIDLGTYRGKIIETLIRSSIVSFAAHTNLDIARGGVNDVLAEKLSSVMYPDLPLLKMDLMRILLAEPACSLV